MLSVIAIKINDRYAFAHKLGLNYSQCFFTLKKENWRRFGLDMIETKRRQATALEGDAD
jgi:hypothetical protein